MTCCAELAGNDGVIMISFVPPFISQACADHFSRRTPSGRRLGLDGHDEPTHDPAARSELDALAAGASRSGWQHCARSPTMSSTPGSVAGVTHIGLGGDFDGVDRLPVGLEDVSGYPRLLAELADRGWSDADLAGLTSGNILRVLQAAQDVADPGFGA